VHRELGEQRRPSIHSSGDIKVRVTGGYSVEDSRSKGTTGTDGLVPAGQSLKHRDPLAARDFAVGAVGSVRQMKGRMVSGTPTPCRWKAACRWHSSHAVTEL